jgi:flagellar protein FlbD
MSFFGILQKIVKNKEENRDAMTKIDNNVEHESAIHGTQSEAQPPVTTPGETPDDEEQPGVFRRGCSKMIKLTRFNSQTNKKGEFVLNAEIIEMIEETPDTVITLTNEKKLIVEEPMDEVVRRVMKYRRALRQF